MGRANGGLLRVTVRHVSRLSQTPHALVSHYVSELKVLMPMTMHITDYLLTESVEGGGGGGYLCAI
jgi:hypothetical protein